KADRPRQTPSRGATESQVFFRNRSVGLMLPERSTSRIYRYAHRWRSHSAFVEHRQEMPIGIQLATEHDRYLTGVFTARLACLPFSWIGGLVCYHWSKDLYGKQAATASLIMWCFSPNIQANASQVIPDLGATSMVIAAFYVLRNWLKVEARRKPVVLGVVLGAALLTKFTTIVLVPIIAMVIVIGNFQKPLQRMVNTIRSVSRELFICFAIALFIINLGYFFEDTCLPFHDYEFSSESLSGIPQNENVKGNRFLTSWSANLPIPFPRNYVLGIDLVKYEFERGYWSYLNGTFQNKGWWYFYIYALAMKEPIGFWGLALISTIAAIIRVASSRLSGEEWMLIGTSFTIICAVSSQTGFTHHMRYAILVLPFWYILSSRIIAERSLAGLQIALLVSVIASSCYSFPHQISYFNELAGGPSNGWKHLNTSNYDWGQSLNYLSKWIERNPDKQPLYVESSGAIPPQVYGIKSPSPMIQVSTDGSAFYPIGWYAICVGEMLKVDSTVRPFLKLKPVDRVAHTVFIYHLDVPLTVGRLDSNAGVPE
ncbi:MAG: ArnT family glycosyltransferase, partial [Pirellula sp.]